MNLVKWVTQNQWIKTKIFFDSYYNTKVEKNMQYFQAVQKRKTKGRKISNENV